MYHTRDYSNLNFFPNLVLDRNTQTLPYAWAHYGVRTCVIDLFKSLVAGRCVTSRTDKSTVLACAVVANKSKVIYPSTVWFQPHPLDDNFERFAFHQVELFQALFFFFSFAF